MAVKNKANAAVKTTATPAATTAALPPSAANRRIEQIGNSLEGKGKTILYALGALIAIGIIGSIIYAFNSRSTAAAQTALGKAIEIQNAEVSASPVPNSPTPVFASDKERAEKAVAAFEDVANKYGNPVRGKALYFAAVNRLKLDRPTALQQLADLSKNSDQETANLAKFALAEANAADGKYDEAAAAYSDLAKQTNSFIPLDTINFALADVYEKQGKKTEAADIYFNLAKSAREAKDHEGKPATITATAREAATRLEKLDAAKYAQLPPEAPPAEF